MTGSSDARAQLRFEFADEILARVDALEEALARPDLAAAAASVHQIKGSALVLELDAVAAEMRVIEKAIEDDPPDRERARAALAAARAAARLELGAPLPAGAGRSRSTLRHDLVTPLNVVTGYAQLLELTELAERERGYVEAIVAAADELGTLIDGIDGGDEAGRGHVDRGPLTVLVIEDDAATARMVESLFEKRPAIKLVVANSGGAGLIEAGRHSPDLVLLDLGLEDVPGIAVLRQIRMSLVPGPQVFVVSADDSPELRRGLVEDGASGFLPKPVAVDGLLHLLDQISARRPG